MEVIDNGCGIHSSDFEALCECSFALINWLLLRLRFYFFLVQLIDSPWKRMVWSSGRSGCRTKCLRPLPLLSFLFGLSEECVMFATVLCTFQLMVFSLGLYRYFGALFVLRLSLVECDATKAELWIALRQGACNIEAHRSQWLQSSLDDRFSRGSAKRVMCYKVSASFNSCWDLFAIYMLRTLDTDNYLWSYRFVDAKQMRWV